ncbi:MAG: transposase [Planctomycetes bacterium]|nr:transposase [Planctomycetota bacterium]
MMPNHVHILVAFRDAEQMLKQCESWKQFTARRINARLKTTGRFWQPDAFDHLVRTEEQFGYLRKYIADNPARARLAAGEFT